MDENSEDQKLNNPSVEPVINQGDTPVDSEPNSSTSPTPEAEPTAEPAIETDSTEKADSASDTTVAPEAEVETESETTVEPETEAEATTESEAATIPDSTTDSEPEQSAPAESASEPDVLSEPQSEPEPALEPEHTDSAAPTPEQSTPEPTLAELVEEVSADEPNPSITAPAEATPVAATPTPEAQPTATFPTETTPVSQPTTRKKSRTPLIILIVFLLCAVIGGIAWWLISRNAPEAQAVDAITKLATTKTLATRGTIDFKVNNSSSPVKSLKLDLGFASDHIPQSSSTTLSVTTSDNRTYKIELGETLTQDGTIYIKIDGLKKALNSAIPEGELNLLEYFEDTITTADGQWWMISIPDVLDQVNDSLDAGYDTDTYADAYQCIIDQVAQGDGQELANLYKKYPFFDIVTSYSGPQIQPIENGNIFAISFNQSQFNSYYNALSDTSYQKHLQACLQDLDEVNFNDAKADFQSELHDFTSQLPVIYAEISGWDHHLSQIYFTTSQDDYSLTTELQFSYPTNVSIDLPNDARAITELVDTFVDNVEDMLYDISSSYYSSFDYSYSSYDEYFN